MSLGISQYTLHVNSYSKHQICTTNVAILQGLMSLGQAASDQCFRAHDDLVYFMYCASICKNKMPYSFLTTVGVVSVFLSEVVFFFILKQCLVIIEILVIISKQGNQQLLNCFPVMTKTFLYLYHYFLQIKLRQHLVIHNIY